MAEKYLNNSKKISKFNEPQNPTDLRSSMYLKQQKQKKTTRHIIIKLLKFSDEDKILKQLEVKVIKKEGERNDNRFVKNHASQKTMEYLYSTEGK